MIQQYFSGDGMGVMNVWASRVYVGQYKHGVSGEEYQHSFETFPHVALSKVCNLVFDRVHMSSRPSAVYAFAACAIFKAE